MHSDTISSNLDKKEIQSIVIDLFDLMLALKKMRIKVKIQKYYSFTQTPQEEEKNEEKRKSLIIT